MREAMLHLQAGCRTESSGYEATASGIEPRRSLIGTECHLLPAEARILSFSSCASSAGTAYQCLK